MPEIWDDWPRRCEAALAACARMGGDCRDLRIGRPATPVQVRIVEWRLGRHLPAAFRQVLLGFSGRVEVTWFLPDKRELPARFRGVFSGDCRWDLAKLPSLEKERRSWVEQCFPNPDDPYDRVWHHKLAFQDVPNGDMLAMDLQADGSPVVYLSHEGDSFHGTVLGRNFADFVDRWSKLGFVGAEDWQLEHFCSSRTNGLDPHGEAARRWLEWFGLGDPPEAVCRG